MCGKTITGCPCSALGRAIGECSCGATAPPSRDVIGVVRTSTAFRRLFLRGVPATKGDNLSLNRADTSPSARAPHRRSTSAHYFERNGDSKELHFNSATRLHVTLALVEPRYEAIPNFSEKRPITGVGSREVPVILRREVRPNFPQLVCQPGGRLPRAPAPRRHNTRDARAKEWADRDRNAGACHKEAPANSSRS